MTFEFYLFLGSFLTFLGPNGLILGLGLGSKTVFWSTHVAEQLLFFIVLSILTFDFGGFYESVFQDPPLSGIRRHFL